MLINLHGNSIKELNLPSLYFERGQMIALTDICVLFTNNAMAISGGKISYLFSQIEGGEMETFF